MENMIEERKFKIDKIIEEYDKRKTQKEVAEKFGMDTTHVSWVTQLNNYKHTRKITPENRKPEDKVIPYIDYEEFEFLDQYSLENFKE